jgi:hypothetical protein
MIEVTSLLSILDAIGSRCGTQYRDRLSVERRCSSKIDIGLPGSINEYE